MKAISKIGGYFLGGEDVVHYKDYYVEYYIGHYQKKGISYIFKKNGLQPFSKFWAANRTAQVLKESGYCFLPHPILF